MSSPATSTPTGNKLKWYGTKQLVVIFFSAFLFFFSTIITAGSTNTVLPMLSAMRGWDNNQILMTMTAAGSLVS